LNSEIPELFFRVGLGLRKVNTVPSQLVNISPWQQPAASWAGPQQSEGETEPGPEGQLRAG
jgi:hypothetical protein